jgi:hypothetical protein
LLLCALRLDGPVFRPRGDQGLRLPQWSDGLGANEKLIAPPHPRSFYLLFYLNAIGFGTLEAKAFGVVLGKTIPQWRSETRMVKMTARGRLAVLSALLSIRLGLVKRHMATFKELSGLSRKYGYDANHNLRYLALARLVSRYQIKELLVLGCGKGVLEYILPEEVRCTSIDIDPAEINLAKEISF